jgi:hypothetical protein
MKKRIVLVALLVVSLVIPVFAAEDSLLTGAQAALDTFSKGCQQELTTFCKDVTPGEGRLLDCLGKNEEKVSSRCNNALKDVGYKK